MKSLRCRTLGVDCDFVTYGNSNQIVITAMFKHSVEDHPDVHHHMFADKLAALVADMEEVIRR